MIPYKKIENYQINIPNKVVDSLSLGLPIISSTDGVIRDLIENFSVGLYLDKNTVKRSTEELKNYLYDRELNINKALKCSQIFEKSYSVDQVYRSLVLNIEDIHSNFSERKI